MLQYRTVLDYCTSAHAEAMSVLVHTPYSTERSLSSSLSPAHTTPRLSPLASPPSRKSSPVYFLPWASSYLDHTVYGEVPSLLWKSGGRTRLNHINRSLGLRLGGWIYQSEPWTSDGRVDISKSPQKPPTLILSNKNVSVSCLMMPR
jgi:hypothetical protein